MTVIDLLLDHPNRLVRIKLIDTYLDCYISHDKIDFKKLLPLSEEEQQQHEIILECIIDDFDYFTGRRKGSFADIRIKIEDIKDAVVNTNPYNYREKEADAHLENFKKAMAYLKKTDNFKMCVEDMEAQMKRLEQQPFEEKFSFLKN